MDGVEVYNNKTITYGEEETPYLNAIVNKYEITKKMSNLIKIAATASRAT